MHRFAGFLLALLVVGCGTPMTSTPPASPSASPSAAVASPTPSPTLRRRPTPVPIGLATCEIAIRTADHLMSVLVSLADAIDDPDEMDRLVDETTEIAEQQLRLMADETHPTIVGWVGILRRIDDATVPHLTGDDIPFIEAVGQGANYANDLKAACS